MVTVTERDMVTQSSAPARRDESPRTSISGIALVAVGLFCIAAIGLVGGWIVNTPPHAYAASLAGLAWSASVAFGIFLVILGAARLARAEGRLIGVTIAAMVAVIGWTAWRDITTWPGTQPSTVLFGAGGTLMLLFFLGAVFYWARARHSMSAQQRAAADLRLFGLAFVVIAAWELCGLFGSPVYLLRPALAATSPLAEYAVPVAATALVYLMLAVGLSFLASAVESRPARDST